jgi:hypothetical protein
LNIIWKEKKERKKEKENSSFWTFQNLMEPRILPTQGAYLYNVCQNFNSQFEVNIHAKNERNYKRKKKKKNQRILTCASFHFELLFMLPWVRRWYYLAKSVCKKFVIKVLVFLITLYFFIIIIFFSSYKFYVLKIEN